MADEYLLKYLLKTAADEDGRKHWLNKKLRLSHVDLSAADLSGGAFLSYDFSDCVLSASVMVESDLSGSDFCDANLRLSDLRRSRFRECMMDRADLSDTNLQYADLTDAVLEGANLASARLEHAELVGADMTEADLTGADLRGASLRYATLAGARIEGANVEGADLTGCIIDDVSLSLLVNLDQALIDDRKYRMIRSRLAAQKNGAAAGESTNGDGTGSDPTAAPPVHVKRKRRIKVGAQDTQPIASPEILDYVATLEDLESIEGCYRVLGIEYGTPLAGITKAFRQKAKKFHPDKVRHLNQGEQDLAAEQFYLSREAYENLCRHLAKPLKNIRWPEVVPQGKSPYDYSIEEYLLLAEANPGHPDILYNLAWKYFEQGFLDEAIESYENVLEHNPKDEDALYNVRIVKLCKVFDLPARPALDAL